MPRKIVARRSPIHGTGVFAIAPLAKGERIMEYKGLRRTHEEVDEGESGAAESGHTFLFTLNDEYVIDGNHGGGVARWINHSCSPNCEAVVEEHPGDDRSKDRIFIEAKKAIRAGEELFYNYGITLAEPHTARMKKIWACRCGARNCTGTLLQPKRKPAVAAKKAVKKAAKAAEKSTTGGASKSGKAAKGTKAVKASRRTKATKSSGTSGRTGASRG